MRSTRRFGSSDAVREKSIGGGRPDGPAGLPAAARARTRSAARHRAGGGLRYFLLNSNSKLFNFNIQIWTNNSKLFNFNFKINFIFNNIIIL
jgi:hypothetical protein